MAFPSRSQTSHIECNNPTLRRRCAPHEVLFRVMMRQTRADLGGSVKPWEEGVGCRLAWEEEVVGAHLVKVWGFGLEWGAQRGGTHAAVMLCTIFDLVDMSRG